MRQADKQKDAFVAVLAHELRNPLNPMNNALRVLETAERVSPEAEQARNILRRQLEHITTLLGELLDISSIRRGTVRLRRQLTDLVPLIRAAVDDHRPTLEARGVRVSTNFPDQPLPVQADATRLAQVVTNLLHNAGKYTPRGGHVEVQLARERDLAVLTVRDDGVGMEAHALHSIFDGYKNIDVSGDPTRGLGLGLPLVKAFVELHGGSVSAESEGRNRGAAFFVRLPLASAPSVESVVTASCADAVSDRLARSPSTGPTPNR